MNKVDKIHACAKQLGLSNLANRPFGFLDEPVSNEDFLIDCLNDEIAYREEKAKQRHVKQAQLPTYKGFETFDTEFQKGITSWQIEQLAGLTWVDGIYNLIMIGPPCTGKTHIALATANKALDGVQSVFCYDGQSRPYSENTGDFQKICRPVEMDSWMRLARN